MLGNGFIGDIACALFVFESNLIYPNYKFNGFKPSEIL